MLTEIQKALSDPALSDRMKKKFEDAGVVFGSEKTPLGCGGRWEIGRNASGDYIAPTSTGKVWRWLDGHGIYNPERGMNSQGQSCCVGLVTKGEHEGKWIGWSHRAAVAFGLGDMLFDAKLLAKSEWQKVPFIKVGTIKIETNAQAKLAASRFARYVS